MVELDKTSKAFEMAKRENLYERLGVSSNATTEEITNAYRQLALLLHPDRNPNRQDEARGAFARINEANETLKDPAKRTTYDQGRAGSSRAQSSQSQSSWSKGAQVDPRHREGYKSEQQSRRESRSDIEKKLRKVQLKALKLFSIEPSKEGVLRWLSNPPERRATPGTFDLVIKAAVGLRLIAPNDVLQTAAITHNLKKGLTSFAGYKGSDARDLEKTLRERGMWREEVFPRSEITAARENHAQKLLADLIHDTFNVRSTPSFTLFSSRFTSLQDQLVSAGWISREGIRRSPMVENAMISIAMGLEKLVEREQGTLGVIFLTAEVQSFLHQSGLTLPDGCKKALTHIYANRIDKELQTLIRDQGLGAEFEVPQLHELIAATDQLGLSVRGELQRRYMYSSQKTTHA